MAALNSAARTLTTLQALQAARVPVARWSRFKHNRRIGWATFKDNIRRAAVDYKTVFVEMAEGAKVRPIQAVLRVAAAAGIAHVALENPTETEYRGALVEANNDLALLPRELRNPVSYAFVKDIVELSGQGRLQYTNLIFCSIVTRREYTPRVRSFEAQHQSFQTWVLSLRERLVDVGFYGHFWFFEQAMVDWDVNF